ncbi:MULTISPECIES: ABC transporter ATP-binding protein [Okeania]|uniref:ABC transporter ATP-binding protein n=1 Tax=Okeania hirsuta TaxID=1458930 RepID=A0A3N6PNK7_9CYAN|nr:MULTISPECIES: ABC transporter ATP-binding protein [Okeania]NES79239.1 ABC transporter ATP-binding protein [Okeania sp. SIO1H4]NES93517.1 ABC transporter ATP-binding protein [Okeania sp. SIO2B9]NET19199.1 ABC transporter ATP-binding protein [Okeania sp. SIO1H5]NET74942.1 ABC transporter ATP-binding protein [Okeania sp. SIO1F9]NET93529.1 ABC transporter ATP-binding protein [Okeania sp. SIO1H2]
MNNPNNTAISFHHVNKIYPNKTIALQDINFTINHGKFVTFVGPSGCGKSTVLRLISKLSEVSSGKVESNIDRDKNELAFVFQEPALMPWSNVIDNVHLPLKLIGKSLRESRTIVQEAINLVGLDGFERSYPRQLSGGMKMRVSIARALVTNPRIVLMDEPFGALDEMTRSKLNSDLLRVWQERNWTVVFVTHNIYEAVYLSQQVIVMAARPGRVVADVKIDVNYPRSEDFRMSQLCNDYCREISNYLEMGVSGHYSN